MVLKLTYYLSFSILMIMEGLICMKKTYKIALTVDFCLFLLCLGILFHYEFYSHEETYGEAITLVTEELSINYLDGNQIKINGTSKEVNFSVTNHSSEIKYYYLKLLNVTGSAEDVSYTLSSNREDFTTLESDFEQTILGSRIEISPNETHRYTMVIDNPTQKEITFQLDADIESIDNSFYSTILSNNEILEKNDGTAGLVRKAEQDGDVYYFTGDVSNNYVSFAGYSWRIIKINEDNTVKLVLNGTTESMVAINESENAGNTNFYATNLNEQLESWYSSFLMDYDDLISSTRYCLDDSVMTDENNQIEYLSHVRIFQEQNPTNTCNGTSISKKIAILTADEVMFAGGTTTENKNYYLFLDGIQSSWWTMTPHKKENDVVFYIAVNTDGSLMKDISETTNLFIRPVITLVKRAKVSGTGTVEDPYVLV